MSIPVAAGDLAKTAAGFDAAYLLTTGHGTGADGRVKAVSVRAVVTAERAGPVVRVAHPGRGSCANVIANPVATVLYPPTVPGGYSLLVDGTAVVVGDDVVLTPGSAVLHVSARS